MERTGWSGPSHVGSGSDHPVCGAKVGCAVFFLMPQPPLLYQEGSFALTNSCVKYIDALGKEGNDNLTANRPILWYFSVLKT
jgi:hypothetical protein